MQEGPQDSSQDDAMEQSASEEEGESEHADCDMHAACVTVLAHVMFAGSFGLGMIIW